MSPIESPYDVRMVTLLGLAISVIEELAVVSDQEPAEILAEYLYRCNKRILMFGEEEYMNKLTGHYPLLEEAIS